ncbi:DsrH/TusB family sulfur metabolism protein [Pseudoalteromonas 'SMAR']|uniref:DsrH/TusB family sulfur metabolism protein n=1 Tax=Pseudoalteromonas 'SMAR' TaxID=3416908 RepID=UPI003AF2F268
MSTLHIISSTAAAQALQYCAKDDVIVLCDDGCFTEQIIGQQPAKIVMLETCAQARGLDSQTALELIDDSQWVELSCHCNNVITW